MRETCVEKQNQDGPNVLMKGRGESGSFYSGGQIASQGEKHRSLLEALEGFLHIERRRQFQVKTEPQQGKRMVCLLISKGPAWLFHQDGQM